MAFGLLFVIGVAVALMGPGAFSVDCRLFGRREIVVPRTRPVVADNPAGREHRGMPERAPPTIGVRRDASRVVPRNAHKW